MIAEGLRFVDQDPINGLSRHRRRIPTNKQYENKPLIWTVNYIKIVFSKIDCSETSWATDIY